MREAETILHEEFAHVLNIQIEDVVPLLWVNYRSRKTHVVLSLKDATALIK